MNSIVPAKFGQISTKFQQQPVTDELSSGIQASFGLIGYKGKVWSIRYRGDETPLMRDDGDGPRGSIEVVILKASQHVSKIWYEQGYVEGSNAPPDCYSNNGITPELNVANKQCDSCALCKHNQWGSRITPAGKAGKACADSKRLAVAPLADLPNEAYGGPLLLRVPAASLQDVAQYGQKLQQLGYPSYAVGTRIAFDTNEAYPKFIFSAIRPLDDDEADIVLAARDGHAVERILSENEFATPAAGPTQEDLNAAFEQPPEKPTQAAKPDTKKADAQTTGTVGDQARAQAEAQKAAAVEKAKKEAAAKAKKEKEAAAAKAKAEAEALAAAAAAETEEPEEDEDEKALREMQARVAAKKAAAKAAAEQEAMAQAAETFDPDTGEVTSDGNDDGEKSPFEADLDKMLDELMP